MPRFKRFTGISLFSGIGGLDLGAAVAGISVLKALDVDGTALESISAALSTDTMQADLAGSAPRELLPLANLPDPDSLIVFGGPPCTGFSHAGFWLQNKRDSKDHQVDRLMDFARYVTQLRPAAFLMENVPGLLFKNHSHHFERFLRSVRASGYTVTYAVVNAADYGIPQRRKRLIAVGVRKPHASFRFPKPLFPEPEHRPSMWALHGLEEGNNPPEADEVLRGRYADLLPSVPPGKNYLVFTSRGGASEPLFEWRSKYWSFLYKLSTDAPSPTVPANRITNNGPFHWTNRHLRLREIARLQAFPDFYPLSQPKSARIHLGNAVPPLLAAVFFGQLVQHLGGEIPSRAKSDLASVLSSSGTYQDLNRLFGTAVG